MEAIIIVYKACDRKFNLIKKNGMNYMSESQSKGSILILHQQTIKEKGSITRATK